MGRTAKTTSTTKNHDDMLSQDQQQQLHYNDRLIYLSGDVTEASISQVIGGILSLTSVNAKAPITLVVSTYGGSVHEMFSLYDIMKYVPCPVRTVGIGKIMSAGVLIMAAGEKGSRLIGRNTRVMIHSISSEAYGTVFELSNSIDSINKEQEMANAALIAETKMSRQTLNKLLDKNVDKYITAQEAIKLGIADKIIG